MGKIILLDASPLGILANPAQSPFVFQCRHWSEEALRQGHLLVVPEIADYEVRRELLRAGKSQSVTRLNTLKATFEYLPITTEAMLRAAEFWANARNLGKPTAHNLRLDADVILAAQASLLLEDGDEVIVATTNPKHLSLFVPAALWQDIR